MKRYCLVGLLLMSAPLQADIYKWTDPNGDVHFSDKPHEGSEKIELPPTQTYSGPANAEEAPLSAPLIPSINQPAHIEYSQLGFLQPTDQSTLRDNQGNLSVSVEMTPNLQPGDTLSLLLDGGIIGKPQTNTTFTLSNVNRGSHTLIVQIQNEQGAVLKVSQPITVFLHRAIAGGGN